MSGWNTSLFPGPSMADSMSANTVHGEMWIQEGRIYNPLKDGQDSQAEMGPGERPQEKQSGDRKRRSKAPETDFSLKRWHDLMWQS